MLGFLAGAKYVNGPWTVGIVGEEYWEQGTVTLSGLTQRKARAPRHRRGLRGGAWLLGVCRVSLAGSDAERHQLPHRGGWYVGAAGVANGANFNNNIKAQGFLVGNVVNF